MTKHSFPARSLAFVVLGASAFACKKPVTAEGDSAVKDTINYKASTGQAVVLYYDAGDKNYHMDTCTNQITENTEKLPRSQCQRKDDESRYMPKADYEAGLSATIDAIGEARQVHFRNDTVAAEMAKLQESAKQKTADLASLTDQASKEPNGQATFKGEIDAVAKQASDIQDELSALIAKNDQFLKIIGYMDDKADGGGSNSPARDIKVFYPKSDYMIATKPFENAPTLSDLQRENMARQVYQSWSADSQWTVQRGQSYPQALATCEAGGGRIATTSEITDGMKYDDRLKSLVGEDCALWSRDVSFTSRSIGLDGDNRPAGAERDNSKLAGIAVGAYNRCEAHLNMVNLYGAPPATTVCLKGKRVMPDRGNYTINSIVVLDPRKVQACYADFGSAGYRVSWRRCTGFGTSDGDAVASLHKCVADNSSSYIPPEGVYCWTPFGNRPFATYGWDNGTGMRR